MISVQKFKVQKLKEELRVYSRQFTARKKIYREDSESTEDSENTKDSQRLDAASPIR